ncbi:hypothetical protein AX17_006804 [Amanita inopinata Kibby_2008]|nr:hypothetical protein AX17_006804 [Amanita inopinata Kibby_2008]
MPSKTFYADAALFDMDGTLTDSIAAVEAAWSKVARDIGEDPAYVIAATHGKRAVDNLGMLMPHIKPHKIEDEVTKFEETILFYADAYNLYGPGSRSTLPGAAWIDSPTPVSPPGEVSEIGTPDLVCGSSGIGSRASSVDVTQSAIVAAANARRPSFVTKLDHLLNMSIASEAHVRTAELMSPLELDGEIQEMYNDYGLQMEQKMRKIDVWKIEAATMDRSVRILPGVRRMIDSIPKGRYAVATSGAKMYAHGCMNRVGITPPPVTITADDKRLKAGKPAPDPFLLAAKCLGYDAKQCVVFEDSPSGIRAGVASGATVIAVCTSHERSKIENCGAHYLVENMDYVDCQVEGGKLKFTVRM